MQSSTLGHGAMMCRHAGGKTLETAAIVIQRNWRGYLARQVAAERAKAVKDVQRYWRVRR